MLAGEILARAVEFEALRNHGRAGAAAVNAAAVPHRFVLAAPDDAFPDSLTWAGVDAAANRFAGFLFEDANVRPGDQVAILCHNHPAWMVAAFGIARAGAVTATIPTRATTDDTIEMLAVGGAKAMVADRESAARLAASGLPVLIAEDRDGMARFLDGPDVPPPDPGIDDTAPEAVTFTGGTMGRPKAVQVSHRSRWLSAEFGLAHFGLADDDRVGVLTPLFHAAGSLVWLKTAALAGLPLWMPPAWDPEAFMAAVEDGHVTNVLLVPTQVHDLLAAPGFDAGRLANLRTLNYAAAPMPLELLQRAMAALPHVTFRHHLGQSESGPIAGQAHAPGDPPERLRAVGRPWDRFEVRLEDPDGNPPAPGAPGEILTRGDHVFDGYLGAPDETAAVMVGGWCRTGDIAVADAEGYLTLVDRAKDMIIAGGVNIYPREIENALYAHPGVSECAVFGIPDDRFGEVPAAHVVLAPDAAGDDGSVLDGAALGTWCAERIAAFKRPRRVEIVASLPKTPVGKIQKHLIRAAYWDGRDRKI